MSYMLTFDKKSNQACYKHNEANCQALLTNEKRDAPKKRVISLSSTFFCTETFLSRVYFYNLFGSGSRTLTLLLKLLTKVFEQKLSHTDQELGANGTEKCPQAVQGKAFKTLQLEKLQKNKLEKIRLEKVSFSTHFHRIFQFGYTE